MPPVNLSSKMWKLQGLPVNHLERKIFCSSTVINYKRRQWDSTVTVTAVAWTVRTPLVACMTAPLNGWRLRMRWPFARAGFQHDLPTTICFKLPLPMPPVHTHLLVQTIPHPHPQASLPTQTRSCSSRCRLRWWLRRTTGPTTSTCEH